MAIEDFRLIPIQGKHFGQYVVVSPEDYEWLDKYSWRLSPQGYAYRSAPTGERLRVLMHREILQPKNGLMTDHIDRNRLNNRRSNLREATASQNIANAGKRKPGGKSSSEYFGVRFRSDSNNWRAEITVNNAKINLGTFPDEDAAARAYDSAAAYFRRERAVLNFPDEMPALFSLEEK